MTDAETSPDVCYRHPQRESWVLCQRCGRTICPECQILAPVGVQCPECVKEAGGSVSWRNAGEIRRPVAKLSKTRRPQSSRSSSSSSSGSGWQGVVGRMLRPGSEAPTLTWGILTIVGIVWLLGFFIPGTLRVGLPFDWLAATPASPLEIWRYLTAAFVYPSDLRFIVSVLFAALFFLLNAPAVEDRLGRSRFLTIFFAGAATGSAAAVLLGGLGFGLTGALFALFGAQLVLIWNYPPARVQVIIMLAFNFVLTVALGGSLAQLIGGLAAGVGATYLFQRYEGMRRSNPRTPYLIIAAAVGAFVLVVIVVSVAF